MPTPSLESRIAHVAALTTCRFCSQVVQSDVVLCPCRVARGELPHTEWPREVKRMLLVRAVERKRLPGTSEQHFWETLAVDAYRGTVQGDGRDRKIIPYSASITSVFQFAITDAATWVAAGCPTPLFTI